MKVSLKALRVNEGLNQKEAAKELNISPATLIKWENNETSPTGVQLLRICSIYHCAIDDIFLPDKLTKS